MVLDFVVTHLRSRNRHCRDRPARARVEHHGRNVRLGRDSVISGIHGLADKPPVDEKIRWLKAAIAEGLSRIERLPDPELNLEYDYRADGRYDAPLAADDNRAPYQSYDGIDPRPLRRRSPLPRGSAHSGTQPSVIALLPALSNAMAARSPLAKRQ
ncbi:hypothetical protein R1A27_32255 (plasmid) [Methylobacterium sp. NMS12]|uniref:hypothetical protein n=1 Tax=Methylobacterium sp. NMS12 TaxID=3079766 RepID=UPI003F881BA6